MKQGSFHRKDVNKRTLYKERKINNRCFDFLSKQNIIVPLILDIMMQFCLQTLSHTVIRVIYQSLPNSLTNDLPYFRPPKSLNLPNFWRMRFLVCPHLIKFAEHFLLNSPYNSLRFFEDSHRKVFLVENFLTICQRYKQPKKQLSIPLLTIVFKTHTFILKNKQLLSFIFIIKLLAPIKYI